MPSIEKRGKNSYRLVVFHGYDLNGKVIKHQKTIHCRNKSEAQIELAKYVAQIETGMVAEGRVPTFKEFVEIWKRDYGSKELAPATYSRYLGMLKSRIIPYLGHFKLDKIKPTDLMRFYDLLETQTQYSRATNKKNQKTLKPLSKKTILEHHRLIRAMLKKAVYWQLLVSNPAERVQPPKVKKPKRKFYNENQSKLLVESLNSIENNTSIMKYKVAILLDLFTGLRLGELMALEWSDIDFEHGIISISKSSQYLPSMGLYTKEPKTESSIRDVSVPDFIVSLLQEYKLWYEEQKMIQDELWNNTNRLFVNEIGNPLYPDTVSKWFVKYVAEIGLPVINFHGLRHTNATLLVAQSIDVATVSARLGHAQITTTYNFYVHPLHSHNVVAGNALENLLLPSCLNP